jgi:hypothetical protein
MIVGLRMELSTMGYTKSRPTCDLCSCAQGPRVKECIDRESNPELGHGKTQCYRYTINAWVTFRFI